MKEKEYFLDSETLCDYGYRMFPTKEEKIEMLKEYKEMLEKETRGVAEKIAELEKKK